MFYFAESMRNVALVLIPALQEWGPKELIGYRSSPLPSTLF